MDKFIDLDSFFSRDASLDAVSLEWATPVPGSTPPVDPLTGGPVITTGDTVAASDPIAPAQAPTAAANPYPAVINLSSLGSYGIKITGAAGSASGLGVAAAGDVNHDGIADFIIGGGGTHATTGGQALGEEYVIFGKAGLSSFTLSPGIAATDGFRIAGEDYPENSGTTFSYTGIGDINHDGFDDVMLGQLAYNSNGLGNDNVGDAFVVFGKATGFGTVQLGSSMGAAGFKITGAQAGGQVGTVSAAGDFNHDGIADFAVGGAFVDANGVDSGAVQVFFGKASGWGNLTFGSNTTPSVTFVGATGDWAGSKISSAGDVNGDGIDDLIINAPHGPAISTYSTSPGYSYVVYGSAAASGTVNLSTMGSSAGFKITGSGGGDFLGIAVAGIGDFNGDGFDDVAVSSGQYYGSAGHVYVVFGKGTGANVTVSDSMAATTGFAIIGPAGSVADAGYSISRAGDVNGDGLADFIIGAPNRNGAGASAAYVIFGKSSGIGTINLGSLSASDGFKIVGASASFTGFSVAGVGDVNGDHVDDLLVSAQSEGNSYIIFGISSNTAPVIDLNGAAAGTGSTLAYIENAAATALAPTAAITDSDSANFDTGTLTVSFTANGAAEDRLSILSAGNGAGQIGVSGNAVSYGGVQFGTFTGGGNGSTPLVVTFDPDATPTAVQALVRAIAYADVSDAPSTASRTVQFVVTDGDGGTSTAASATVSVTAVNDAPVVDLHGAALSYTENGAATAIAPSATVTDADSPDMNGGALSVQLGANVTSADQLAIQNQGNGAGQIGINGSNITYGGATIGTFTGGANGSTLSVSFTTASATPAAVQALMRDILYSNTSDAPSTATRVATFSLRDGDGVANSGADTTAVTANVSVTAVNDAPSGTDATINVRHGVTHTLTAADFGFTDVDGNAFNGVTIDTIPSQGRLLLATGGSARVAVTPGQVISAADITAGKLIYKPNPGVNDPATGSFTFQVHDNGGTASGGVDTDPTANTLTFTVPPNQAPSGSDATIAVQHGTPHVMTLSDFGFSDPDGDGFVSVTIDTVPTAGTGRLLYSDGVNPAIAVTANQVITATDIAAGKLVYKPTPGASDPATGSFTFQVHDDGGTGNGGIDTDPAPNALTFTVPTPPAANLAHGEAIASQDIVTAAGLGGYDAGTHTSALAIDALEPGANVATASDAPILDSGGLWINDLHWLNAGHHFVADQLF